MVYFSLITSKSSLNLLFMPALSAEPWTDCVTGYWHKSVFMFVSCVHVCVRRCAVLIAAQRSMCGRGSSHVLRPSAPLSILVGALACGGPTRVTGKRQSASCERACSGKIPPVSPLHNGQCSAYKVPILSGSHGDALVHGPQTIFTMKMFFLAQSIVCVSLLVCGSNFNNVK